MNFCLIFIFGSNTQISPVRSKNKGIDLPIVLEGTVRNTPPNVCLSLSPSLFLSFFFFSPSPYPRSAIYNIVSQRQMSGRSDSDFSPASNVVPITVEPTQNASNKGMCCQNN